MAVTPRPRGSPENLRKAFDLADGWAKHIATLATATIVLSATFVKDLFPADSGLSAKGWLYAAWILLLASILASVFVIGGITSELSRADDHPDVYRPTIRWAAVFEFGFFVAGIGAFAFFVGSNL